MDGKDVFLLADSGADIDCEGLRTDGRIVAVGWDRGETEWFLVVDATSATINGADVLRAKAPVTVALDAERDGAIVAAEATGVTLSFGPGEPLRINVNAGATRLEAGRSASAEGSQRAARWQGSPVAR